MQNFFKIQFFFNLLTKKYDNIIMLNKSYKIEIGVFFIYIFYLCFVELEAKIITKKGNKAIGCYTGKSGLLSVESCVIIGIYSIFKI